MVKYTIKDIAKLAGVSTGSVSRVLNGAMDVAPDIHEKTMKILKECGYLDKKRSRKVLDSKISGSRIAVVLPEMSAAWVGKSPLLDWLAGIETGCRENNFSFEVQFLREDLSPSDWAKLLSSYDGILIKTPVKVPEFLQYLPPSIPVVFFGGFNPLINYPKIAIDDRAAGMVMTEMLLENNHKDIVFINHFAEHIMFAARCSGFMEVMLRNGLLKNDSILIKSHEQNVSTPETTFPDMDWAVEAILKMPKRPTAILISNDWGTAGFYNSCKKYNLSLPADFSVVGFDNFAPICEILSPALTSYQFPMAEVAKFATETLVEHIQNASNHRNNSDYAQFLGGKIIKRNSIKAI